MWWTALLAALLAFGFLGSRGIWDPDEGRYTNVALTMLDRGDWLNPQRNDEVGHWTKPPLTYWTIAGSVAAFGRNPWAARLPIALSYLFCVWMAWRCAGRLAPGTQATAAIVYASMLLPFGAANYVTTDFILAATQALAVHAFIEARFGAREHAQRWLLLMWAAYAAAFMTKGPPGLLPLLATATLGWLAPSSQPRRWLPVLWGTALFLALVLPWFAEVTLRHEGLVRYYLGAEVVDRVASDRFQRHGEWYGWLQVYGPTLALGTLPWTPALWRWCRALPRRLRAWHDRSSRQSAATELLLVLWVALPLVVFCLSQSRLPLYLLPLFVPLAIVVALQRQREGHGSIDRRWLCSWVVVLLGLRLAAAGFPSHKDASVWAREIRARSPEVPTEVIFVDDMARYGLHLHLGVEIEKVSLEPQIESSRFDPVYDGPLATELREAAHESGAIYIVKQAHWPSVRTRIEALGYAVSPLGRPYRGRVMFKARPNGSPPAHDDGA